jgi:hypothetical protein
MFSRWIVTNITSLPVPCIAARLSFLAGISGLWAVCYCRSNHTPVSKEIILQQTTYHTFTLYHIKIQQNTGPSAQHSVSYNANICDYQRAYTVTMHQVHRYSEQQEPVTCTVLTLYLFIYLFILNLVLKAFELYNLVITLKLTDVSEVRTASIIRTMNAVSFKSCSKTMFLFYLFYCFFFILFEQVFLFSFDVYRRTIFQ